MRYEDEKDDGEQLTIKKAIKSEIKKKKVKYKVTVVTPSFVYYSDEYGNGCQIRNTWKDLKVGDEISL